MTEERKFVARVAVWLLALGIIPVVILVRDVVERRPFKAQMECVANLQQMDGAIQSWGLENKKAQTDTYSLTDTTFLGYLKGSVLPHCPLNGTYSAGTNMGDVMKCSFSEHTLRFRTPMGYGP